MTTTRTIPRIPLLPLCALVVVTLLMVACGKEPAPTATAPSDLSVTSPKFTEELLGGLDTSPSELIDEVINRLVSGEVTEAQRAEIVQALMAELLPPASGDSSSTPDEATLANALVRRLGPQALSVGNLDELVTALAQSIDPDDSIESADNLVAAVGDWAGKTSATVLRVTSGGAANESSQGISGMSFEEASIRVKESSASSGLIEMPVPGIPDLPEMGVPGIQVSVDEETRTIVFSGQAQVLQSTVDLVIVARWGIATPLTCYWGWTSPTGR